MEDIEPITHEMSLFVSRHPELVRKWDNNGVMAIQMDQLVSDLVREVCVQYQTLGLLEGAYVCGSLINGFTADSDLDMNLIWHDDVPTNRQQVVSLLNTQLGKNYLVVDYEAVHLDRYYAKGQEFNVGHISLYEFEKNVSEVLDGNGFLTREVIQPLVAVSGFYYGWTVFDRNDRLVDSKSKLAVFPEKLKSETMRVLNNRIGDYLDNLGKFKERNDWYMFNKMMTEAIEVFLVAWFSSQSVYFLGNKWVKENIKKFNLDGQVGRKINNIFDGSSSLDEKLAIFKQLISKVNEVGY